MVFLPELDLPGQLSFYPPSLFVDSSQTGVNEQICDTGINFILC